MAVTAVTGLALDQLTKYLAVAHLGPQAPIRLLGGLLRLQLIRNPGAAFSLGEGSTVAISLLAILATAAMLFVVAPRVRTPGAGLLAGLATAGIAGNLVDRLVRPPSPLRGHVIDFFQLPHFAIFNVADIFITCTAAILVVGAFRGDEPRTRKEETQR
ncbi:MULTISPECIES: signal peptidase II [unclassified Luteococcus]|uniref:signal peptidase II n=1 Tax=unclassified Luteococcus TaxID=2639923 RepID=UPI00313D9334